MEEFPANSKKDREPKPAAKDDPKKKELTKAVVTGTVVEKKRGFGAKIHDVFIGGEFKSAAMYITAEVLVPALRNLIVDATTNGIERIIYGDTTPRRPSGMRGGGGASRVSYNRPVERYSPQQRAYMPGQARDVPIRHRDINDVVIPDKFEAELVVERLGDIISQYNVASVRDFKELVGLDSTFVDESWGWTSISFIEIRHVREGWLISLPPVEAI